MDLSIIILFQIIALSYGVFNIAQGRPVWIVYSVDRFELVCNNEIYEKNTQNANREYQHTSWLKLQYVATQFSVDNKERNDNLFDEVLAGVSIAQRPERYVPIKTVKNQIKSRSQDLNLLSSFNSDSEVAEILEQYPSANALLPLKANALDMVILINKENAEVFKIVDLRPWN